MIEINARAVTIADEHIVDALVDVQRVGFAVAAQPDAIVTVGDRAVLDVEIPLLTRVDADQRGARVRCWDR